jgi:hypothetical protein
MAKTPQILTDPDSRAPGLDFILGSLPESAAQGYRCLPMQAWHRDDFRWTE